MNLHVELHRVDVAEQDHQKNHFRLSLGIREELNHVNNALIFNTAMLQVIAGNLTNMSPDDFVAAVVQRIEQQCVSKTARNETGGLVKWADDIRRNQITGDTNWSVMMQSRNFNRRTNPIPTQCEILLSFGCLCLFIQFSLVY